MAKEIERKYLVANDFFKSMATNIHTIKQGYISLQKEAIVRVRIRDIEAFITIKGISNGASRDEWEYSIPTIDAEEMLSRLACGKIIDKTRYIVNFEGHVWEVDEFHGAHQGLVIAEIELKAEDETFPLPCFIGKEVTGDTKYYNSTLAGI